MWARGVSASSRSRRRRRKKPYRQHRAPAPAMAAISAGFCTPWLIMSSAASATMGGSRRYASAREGGLEVDVRLLVRLEVQQLCFREVAEPGDQHARERGDAHVVGVDGVVVDLAPVGDRGLEAADAILEVAERLVGLELGVVLGDRVQAGQAGTQLALGGTERGHVAGAARGVD